MMNQAKLKTLTPVHIGSGVEFQSNIEYLFDGEKIGIIDEKKVLEVIGEENIDKWVNIIEQRGDLLDYLKQRKQDFSLHDISRRVVSVMGNNIGRHKSLREQLHNGRAQPMIPGSSIKGAIRTALLSRLVMQNQENIDSSLLKIYQNNRYKWSSKNLENRFLGDTRNDPFRFLHVSDAHFDPDTVALNMEIMNLFGKGWDIKQGGNQLTEMIWGEDETSMRIGLQEDLIQANQTKDLLKFDYPWLKDIKLLLSEVNNHTGWLLEKEFDFWNEEEYEHEAVNEYIEILKEVQNELSNCADNQMVLRIGHGSGWHFITGGWAKYLENILSENEYEQLAGFVGKRGAPVFPKTRKMYEKGDLLGFVKITI
ncbi:MAG: type III-A CRISPR-associated RAMP protein Csm5 [bacterium]